MVGNIEGAWAIKHKELYNLSAQGIFHWHASFIVYSYFLNDQSECILIIPRQGMTNQRTDDNQCSRTIAFLMLPSGYQLSQVMSRADD